MSALSEHRLYIEKYSKVFFGKGSVAQIVSFSFENRGLSLDCGSGFGLGRGMTLSGQTGMIEKTAPIAPLHLKRGNFFV